VVEWVLVAALVTLGVAALTLSDSFRRLDNIAYDLLQRTAARPADPDILIVEIDDQSIAALGAWPWSRTLHAQMVERLAAARPRAIAYDLLFSEPSPEPGADRALGAAIRSAGNVFLPSPDAADGTSGGWVRQITGGAAGLGLVHVRSDTDGLVRRTIQSETHNGRVEIDLMGQVDRATRPDAASASAARPGEARLIPFGGGTGRFRTVSFSSVLKGEVPEELIRGKIVLVGVTATGLGERFSTPTTGGDASLSGIELQANVLEALRTGTLIRPAGKGAALILSILPVWMMLPAFWLLSPRWNLLASAALALGAVAASAALFAFGHLWLAPSGAILGLAVLTPLWGWRRLAALSDYLGAELQRLGLSAPALRVEAADFGADVISRQAASLEAAITQIEEMRRFASDALFSLPDATLVVDPEGLVIAANGVAQTLFEGPGLAMVEGRLAGDLINALEPRGRRFASDWPAGQAFERALSFDLADGRSFEAQVVERPPEEDAGPGGEGGRTAWILRLADVTALKAALRQREHAIQLLTHDMRSPQISILALIDSAGEGAISGDLAGRISGYSRRTLDMADGFVHLARAEEAGAGRDIIDLCDVTNEAVDEMWPQSRQRRMQIRQKDCEAPRYVRGDRQILTRALINLISNAIKYGPEGSVVDVYMFGREHDGRAMVGVAVMDQGGGLTQEEAVAAFEPFRRFERSHPADGVGLGLAFVRAAASRHGGLASCHSAPGQGATFSFELPEEADPAESSL
jgi:CHASE2 domain-containing sensor protein/signal transduction histidine kinase